MKKAMFFACAALSLAMLSCSGGEAKSSENAEEVVKEVEDSATWLRSANTTQTISPSYTVNGKSPYLIHSL